MSTHLSYGNAAEQDIPRFAIWSGMFRAESRRESAISFPWMYFTLWSSIKDKDFTDRQNDVRVAEMREHDRPKISDSNAVLRFIRLHWLLN